MGFDFLSRMAELQGSVRSNELDAYVVASKENIYYLCGATYTPLERPFFILIYPDEAPALLVPLLEQEHMRKARGFDDVRSYREYPARPGEGWQEALLELLSGKRRIGVEPSLRLDIANALVDKEVLLLPLVEDLRMVKSPDELDAIRRAARYADDGMERMFRALYMGATPLELFSLSRKTQTKVIMAGEYDPLASEFLTACWPAPASAQPHSIPPLGAKAGSGPAVLMSLLRVNGYAAECERTVFLKEPDKTMRDAFRAMEEARKLAFGMLKPGAECARIDLAVREFLTREGYGENLLHRVGHGIGLGNHEGPWLSEGSGQVLKENMVVSVEPGIYLPDVGGFRHSDTVLITGTGYECLTKFPVALPDLVQRKAKPVKRLKGLMLQKLLKLR